MAEGGSIKHFTDLIAWQKSHEFVKEIYLLTRHFPDSERFGLVDQIRRAASSVTANLAEGYGRYYFKDKIRFYYQARGSNTECQNHLILSNDLGYLSDNEYLSLKIKVFESYKVIWGLIKASSTQI